MARIDRATFLEKFVPMAKAGKTADEIGAVLGIEGKQVSQKATVYRRTFNEFAVKHADKQKLEGEEREKYLASVKALVPKLTSRTRTANKLGDYLADLLEAADEAPE